MLDETPWAKQSEILESLRDNYITSVASCHAAGKSYIAARAAIWFLLAFGPDCIVITTAPTGRQVRSILWQEIRVAAAKLRRKVPIGSKPLLTRWDMGRSFDEKWFALGFASSDYNVTAATGWHAGNVLVILDEACGMADDVIDGLIGCLHNPRTCRLLKIGNPTDPVSEFGREHQNAGGSFNISAFDTPNFTEFGITAETMEIKPGEPGNWRELMGDAELPWPMLVTPDWVDVVRKKWGQLNPLYLAKVLGQFPDDNPHGLFPMSLIERCHRKKVEPEGAGILALDVGREGDDPSVLGRRRGRHYRKIKEYRRMNLADLRQKVSKVADYIGPEEFRIDSIGIGAGPADEMRKAGYPMVFVNFSEASTKPLEYYKYRTECYFHLAEVMDDCLDLDPDDDDLTAQLAAITYGPHGQTETVLVTPKEKLKRSLGRSLDDADALAIAYAPVKPALRAQIFV